jgi:hypothetical protein
MTRYQILPQGVLDTTTGTAIAPDLSSAEWQTYRQWLKDGNTPLPPDAPVPHVPTADEIQASVVLATQARLDDFARTRAYDGILSACTYATSSIPKFADEGQAAVDARDSTWAVLYTIMAEVLAGTRPMPASFADVEPLLPALVWPTL